MHPKFRTALLVLALVTTGSASASDGAQAGSVRDSAYALAGIAVLVAQTALIVGLLRQRRHIRKAEEELRAREAELRTSYDRIRDIGMRLLTAQEGERARIAGELHDDISQQLALLHMTLQRSGNVEEALARVDAIFESLRELSHRLHPTRLQRAGLVPSLRALQEEHSRAGFAVVFEHADVPVRLPPNLVLCLIRVVQEALQNAIKYSQAEQAAVDLRRGPAGLVLTIADDGVGFELEGAWRKGLGLVSIRERVEAIGGAVVIRTAPGAGTRVEVLVPLEDNAALRAPFGSLDGPAPS